MAFTYDTTLSAQKDQVRLLIGDTDSTDPLLQDEEIVFLIAEEGGLYQAASAACVAIAAQMARDGNVKIDVISLSNERTSEHFLSLAARLRDRLSGKGLSIFAGGITDSGGIDKQPAFTRDLHGNPGGSGITSI